jgi:NADPH2:quinone reductase
MKTEAIFLKKYGEAEKAFALEQMEIEDPNENEVQIDVEGFGLNYADVMARKGLYGEAPKIPCVLGYEVVGKVSKVGNVSLNNLLGKNVLAITRFGGYAKKVNVPALAIIEIGTYDTNKALCLATQYATAYYMAFVATNVQPGDKVLVHAAAGGVGTALIQLLRSKNVTIIAKIGNDDKVAYLKKMGVQYIVNYKKSDYATQVASILKGNKLSVSFNPVGGKSFRKDWKLLAPTGKLILFGGSALSSRWGLFSKLNFVRQMGIVVPIACMMRSKSILGINMLRVAEEKPQILQFCMQHLLELAREGAIDPQVGEVFSAGDIVKAHTFLASGKSTGKLVVRW